jgi:signal peptidase I
MLLGDNRDQSLDSRFMGFIPREVIRGKALFIYYSIDPIVDRPAPRVLTAVRWDRIGMIIR